MWTMAGVQESTLVVLAFDECVAETEAEMMKMHVEISASSSSSDDDETQRPVETPTKAVVYWLNSHAGYFMAPGNNNNNNNNKQICIAP